MKDLKSLTSVKLAYAEYGNPEAPKKALMVHGITLAGNSFWRMASRLAKEGYSVRAADMRGHGLSPATETYELPEMAADVWRLKPEGGGAWDLVVGHSLGGIVLSHVMAYDPDFTKAALLIDPALKVPIGLLQDVPAFRDEEMRAVKLHDPEVLRAEAPDLHMEDIDRKAKALFNTTPYTVKQIFTDNPTWDGTPLIEAISCPLFILGADETVACIPGEYGEALAAANDNVTFIAIPSSNHGIHRTHPDEVMKYALEVAALGAK